LSEYAHERPTDAHGWGTSSAIPSAKRCTVDQPGHREAAALAQLSVAALKLGEASGSHAIGNLDGVGTTLLGAGTTLTATHVVQNSLTVGADAKVSVRAAAGTLSVLCTLSLGGAPTAPAGSLNLNDHDLIVTNGSAADVALEIAAGRAGGTWNGKCISSLAAGTNSRFALAYMQNGAAGAPRVAAFDDRQGLTGGEVLVKYTLLGDTNLDGLVDGADFSFLASNFGQSGKAWTNGDFNYDGIVDGADFSLLASNFGLSTANFASPAPLPAALQAFAATVPEPTVASVLLVAAGGMLLRRRWPWT